MSKSVVAAYNAYPLTNENKYNNEINARRLGFQQGYEQAEKEYKNQWVSVEEALPEVNEFVFGCVNDEGTPQAVGMAYYDEYGGWHYSDEEEISLITHWMQIPSLKGGEG